MSGTATRGRKRTQSDSERAVRKNIARIISQELLTQEMIDISVQIVDLKARLKLLIKQAKEGAI